MCDPATLALIATGVSAGTAIYSGQQQKESANYQAKQARNDAEAEVQAGAIRAEKQRERAKRVAASARASLAASGMSLNSESADMINADIIRRGELDAINEQNNSLDAASRLRNEAQVLKQRGRNAQIAGYTQAAGSVLNSYSSTNGWR